jgi:hypothetical protein
LLVAPLTARLAPLSLYLGMHADGGFVQPAAAGREPDDPRAAVVGVTLERE